MKIREGATPAVPAATPTVTPPPAANDNKPNWLAVLFAALVGIFRKAA